MPTSQLLLFLFLLVLLSLGTTSRYDLAKQLSYQTKNSYISSEFQLRKSDFKTVKREEFQTALDVDLAEQGVLCELVDLGFSHLFSSLLFSSLLFSSLL